MAAKYKLKCIECGKEDAFDDVKDITYHKWTIIFWDVKSCDPVCTCDKCEYNPNKKKK